MMYYSNFETFWLEGKWTNAKVEYVVFPYERDEIFALALCLFSLYLQHVKTITTDNGSEFSAHTYVTEKIKAPVFFADPYFSWQKRSIENANKLIRQYIPKGVGFDDFSDEFIKSV